MRTRSLLTVLSVAAALASGSEAAAAPALGATRLSVSGDGTQANGPSYFEATSGNGRFVVFSSDATDLVAGDTNGVTDVFLHDRQRGETRRVSVDGAGQQGNGRSFASGVSRNGRLVVFWSHATNLVPDDTNASSDVFVHDVKLGTTTRVSVGPGGAQANAASRWPTLSEDGRWIAFQSFASNLVEGDTNDVPDVFLHELRSGATTRIGLPGRGEFNDGSGAPSLSANGRFVAWETRADNVVPDDSNGQIDVFVLDRRKGTIVRASVTSDGAEVDEQSRSPVLSGNGRRVAFTSLSDALVSGDANGSYDAFVHDLRRRETIRVSIGAGGEDSDGNSAPAAVARSGRYVLVNSHATNLVSGDTNGREDTFVHDLVRGTTTRLQATIDAQEPDGETSGAAFAASGRFVLLHSSATNLVPDDTNGTDDVFLYRLR